VTRRFEAAQVFAYVDNCLDPVDRRAFDSRLREEPELRREVAQWEAQNSAIRAAYGAPATVRVAPDLGGASNENLPFWMAAAMPPQRKAAASRAGATGPARSADVARPHPRFAGWRIAALAALLLAISAPSGPTPPQRQLFSAGLAAYRAFAAASGVPIEFATHDPQALTSWLAPQFAREIRVPRLASDELTLLGGRIAPGATANAAFLVYEDRRRRRVGLLIEPLDAPAPSAPRLSEAEGVSVAVWTDAGAGFAAAGSDPEPVSALTRLSDQAPARR